MHIKIQEDSIKETLEVSEKIDWKVNNFPSFFPIVQIGFEQLGEESEALLFARRGLKAYRLLVLFYIVNTGCSVVQLVTGYGDLGWLLYGLLQMILMSIIALGVFYRGHRASAFDNSMFKNYFFQELGLVVFILFCLKVDIGGYNGVQRVYDMIMKEEQVAPIVGIVANLVVFLSIYFRILCLYQAVNWGKDDL